MSGILSRRRFLKRSAVAGGALVAARFVGAPAILAERSPNSKLGTALIGCGRRGVTHLPAAAGERLVALADTDENMPPKALKWLKDNADKLKLKDLNVSGIRTFTDYRKLFDEAAKDIDAVFIATPDHQHACPAMIAMKLGKGVYCEKPLTYDIAEARALAEAARKYKVATQMGNQGHAGAGVRRMYEYLQAGAVGNVTEVHCWRALQYGGGARPASEPAPKGLHWDDWIGPAPYRDYHKGLHPVSWLGWWDFSSGMLGGWGPHVLDPAFFCLKLGGPVSVEAVEQVAGEPEGFPKLNVIRYDFPARDKMPAVKLYWYDGSRSAAAADAKSEEAEPASPASAWNRPALAREIEKKHSRNLGQNGSLFIGEKGLMYIGPYGDGARIIPEEKHKEFPPPDKTLPRVKSIFDDFVQACKGGTAACSNFADYSGPFTEAMLVGKLAMKAGKGRKVEWDAANMKCTNIPELNQYVKREYRKGWTL